MKPAWKPIKVKLGQIKAWDKNPRMSTKAQAQRIIASERKFGQPVPFLISPDFLLYDGHQRLAAWFTVYGADYEMDAMQSDRPLSEDEHKELVITLHTGATGSWNWDALSGWSAGDLQEWGMNGDALKGWNNDANNLKELLNADNAEPVDAEPQIDRAAELAEKWQTESGQLWKLGEHRLLIGDCTVRENVERLMGGERAGVCFTSPPYADQREYTKDGDLSPSHLSLFISAASNYVNCFCVNLGMKRENGEIIEYWQEYINTAKQSELKLLSWNIWDKGRGGSIGSVTAMFPIEHEFIFVFGKEKTEILATIPNQTAGQNKTARVMSADGSYSAKQNYVSHDFGKMGTIYRGRQVDKNDLHPAMFPVEFSEAYISVFGGHVYEPFGGSGTTIIAAHNLNRRCFAMEISEKYGAVILERFQTATGITPELVD